MNLVITILPVVTKDLPISPRFTPYDFLSRCKFSTLTTRQPMVEEGSNHSAFVARKKSAREDKEPICKRCVHFLRLLLNAKSYITERLPPATRRECLRDQAPGRGS